MAKNLSLKKKIIGLIVSIIALLAVGFYGYESYMYVSTDNAQVGGPSTLLSSKVSGIIVRALVDENQKVKANQVLVEIKPDDYQNMVNQLKSEMASLAAQHKAAQANY